MANYGMETMPPTSALDFLNVHNNESSRSEKDSPLLGEDAHGKRRCIDIPILFTKSQERPVVNLPKPVSATKKKPVDSEILTFPIYRTVSATKPIVRLPARSTTPVSSSEDELDSPPTTPPKAEKEEDNKNPAIITPSGSIVFFDEEIGKQCVSCKKTIHKYYDVVKMNWCDHHWCKECANLKLQNAISKHTSFPPNCCSASSKMYFDCSEGYVNQKTLHMFGEKTKSLNVSKGIKCTNKECDGYVELLTSDGLSSECIRCVEPTMCQECEDDAHFGSCTPVSTPSQHSLKIAREESPEIQTLSPMISSPNPHDGNIDANVGAFLAAMNKPKKVTPVKNFTSRKSHEDKAFAPVPVPASTGPVKGSIDANVDAFLAAMHRKTSNRVATVMAKPNEALDTTCEVLGTTSKVDHAARHQPEAPVNDHTITKPRTVNEIVKPWSADEKTSVAVKVDRDFLKGWYGCAEAADAVLQASKEAKIAARGKSKPAKRASLASVVDNGLATCQKTIDDAFTRGWSSVR